MVNFSGVKSLFYYLTKKKSYDLYNMLLVCPELRMSRFGTKMENSRNFFSFEDFETIFWHKSYNILDSDLGMIILINSTKIN